MANLIELQKTARESRDFLRGLLEWADAAITGRQEARRALDWPMPDYEDALHPSAAVACNAQVILTRNVGDFKISPFLR